MKVGNQEVFGWITTGQIEGPPQAPRIIPKFEENGSFWSSLTNSRYKTTANGIPLCAPLESMIRDHRSRYYDTIQQCNAAGEFTEFISFVLQMIDSAIITTSGIVCIRNLSLQSSEGSKKSLSQTL